MGRRRKEDGLGLIIVIVLVLILSAVYVTYKWFQWLLTTFTLNNYLKFLLFLVFVFNFLYVYHIMYGVIDLNKDIWEVLLEYSFSLLISYIPTIIFQFVFIGINKVLRQTNIVIY